MGFNSSDEGSLGKSMEEMIIFSEEK